MNVAAKFGRKGAIFEVVKKNQNIQIKNMDKKNSSSYRGQRFTVHYIYLI